MDWRIFYTIFQSKKALAFLLLAVVALFALGLQKETTVKTEVLSGKKVLHVSPTVAPTSTPKNAMEAISEEATPTEIPDGPTPTPATIILQVTQMQQKKEQGAAVVHVSVSGGSSFDIEVGDNINQCDVLTKAQADGKIHDLVMKFDSNAGSYGVYKINGIGKENAVWWTYAVNGQDPPKGCSYIKANNGDRVEWKYIGS